MHFEFFLREITYLITHRRASLEEVLIIIALIVLKKLNPIIFAEHRVARLLLQVLHLGKKLFHS